MPDTANMSLYQIQQLAFNFADEDMIKKLEAAIVKDIEDSAFKRGISVGEVMNALGVVLRDKIFELKGVSIDDL